MLDDIGRITARISEIQDKLSALSGQPPAAVGQLAPLPGQAQAAGHPFAEALGTAQAAGVPSPIPLTGGPIRPTGPQSPVVAPPASLGPLPGTGGEGPLLPLPVAPCDSDVIPIPHTASAGYDDLIQKYAGAHGLEPSLVRAVIQTESGGNPRAVSRAGAVGLMQLMPENVKEAGLTDPFDPAQNIAAGTRQLSDLLGRYGGNLDLALAGYNAGPGNVHKYGGVPPFTETQNYIKRVRAAMEKG